MNANGSSPNSRQVFGSPPSKLSAVSYPNKSSPENSPGTRIPASQPRKWLRVDEQGRSAYIKVAVALPVTTCASRLRETLTVLTHQHSQVEKHQLVGSLNIPYRDLRILDPLVGHAVLSSGASLGILKVKKVASHTQIQTAAGTDSVSNCYFHSGKGNCRECGEHQDDHLCRSNSGVERTRPSAAKHRHPATPQASFCQGAC